MEHEKALAEWIQYARSLNPDLLAWVGTERKEYCLTYQNRKLTGIALKRWFELGLNQSGHELILRGGGRLYTPTPLPQNRGNQLEPKTMLTVAPQKSISLIEMLQGLRPSRHLFSLLLELQGSKTICIYKNQPEQGYPCSFVLPSITPARLNLPIDQYIGQPVRAIDNIISSQRQHEMEEALRDYQAQGEEELPPRRQFTSQFRWSNLHWELINRTWYDPESDSFIVTVEDPNTRKGLAQREFFLGMIEAQNAEPTPLYQHSHFEH